MDGNSDMTGFDQVFVVSGQQRADSGATQNLLGYDGESERTCIKLFGSKDWNLSI